MSRQRDLVNRQAEGLHSDGVRPNSFGVAKFIRRPIRFTYLRLACLAILCCVITPMELIIGASQRLTITSLTLTVSLLTTASVDILWLAFRKRNESLIL